MPEKKTEANISHICVHKYLKEYQENQNMTTYEKYNIMTK